jgi:hypothetical protein
LVGFRAGVTAGQRAATERAAGALDARLLGPAVKPAGHGRVAGQEYLAPFALRVPAKQELAVVARLRRDHAVAYAEPDYLLSASATPNDTSFPVQWAARNTGQPIATQEINENVGPPAAGTPGADAGAYKAWQLSTGSRSVVIGEADTGVDYTHPDLAANIWSNPGGVGGCPRGTHGYNVRAQTCNPMDEDTTYAGHGTHVAGILGAVGNNGQGVAGMNWQTSILPVKWMNNASHGETSALIEALQWLVVAKQSGVNVRVVNDSDTFWGTAYSQALSNEIDVLGANNILFVTSAGNTGNNNDEVAVQRYPCSYNRPTEICVAPLDSNDQLPSWANYGAHTVDLAAPGVSIYSTLRGGAYGYLSGSSMAAPQVAGAAALILSKVPSLPAAALKADILENVDHLPALAGRVISGGALDVCKALPGCSKLAPKPPTSTAAPTISGPTALGGTLTEAHGSWTGEPTSFVYQWMRCDASGNNCQPIIGATGQTYAPAAGDVGHALRTLETAINAGGASNPASSLASAAVVGALPVNTARPSISGWAYAGQTLTAGPGGWSEHPTLYAYQWQRCDYRGSNCAAISLATAATYTVVGADAESTLRVSVVASNALGSSAPATSARTEAVAVPQAPVSISPPTISGTPVQGQTLTEAPGTWAGEPSSFLYRWLRCDASGSNCQLLSSASRTYTLLAGDVGHTLRALEAASNEGGMGYPGISTATAVIVRGRPVSTVRPTISGTARVGQTLSATTGSFSENPTGYAYQWQRCDSQGSNCAAIAPATTQSYTLGEADAGTTLRVAVVASNAAGPSAPAASNSTPAVSWQQPVNTGLPSISGRAQAGQTLTASPGTWTGSPPSYAYQWQRCDASGGNCQAIASATGTTYPVGEADVESTLRVVVTASNPSGQTRAATSGPTEVVGAAQAPTNTAAPTISGNATQGQALTEVHGSWTSEPTSYAYQWLRCDISGGNCQQLFGATAQAYVPLAGDVGHTLRVQETATSAAGSSSPEGSAPSGTVAPQANAATFGKTTVGAFADGGLFSDYKIVHSASLAAAGSVLQLSVYAVPGVQSPSPQSVKAVIYADSGGAPGALLATGTEVVYRGNLNGSGWLDLPLASALSVQPGTYWIGFITGPMSEGMGYAYDSVQNSRAYNTNAYSSGPSDPFGAASLDSEQASIYATYVPGA